MEDRHIEIGERNADERFSFYGIFDGHGGQSVSAVSRVIEPVTASAGRPRSLKRGEQCLPQLPP
jgi:serine/threonine protein phosphatase PrpC